MVIDDVISLGGEIIGLFTPREPTPEEQKAKAGVWYNMLSDWVNNQPQDSVTFGAKWKDFLPFAQSKTKTSFINNNINGKSYDSIVNTLVGKINDELVKGGFPRMSKDAILTGMGAGGSVADTSGGLSISGGDILTGSAPLGEAENAKESKNFFLIMLGVVFVGLIAIINFTDFKKKRR